MDIADTEAINDLRELLRTKHAVAFRLDCLAHDIPIQEEKEDVPLCIKCDGVGIIDDPENKGVDITCKNCKGTGIKQ